ncbi:unnamed protein product [Rangifer tarandus platyrhynchus]|uniref:Uncharacterized protein n=1 Tax=Rangifer tarandus platyrhynchus TaxID=3082113 RepID=A0ABN8YJQ2_RANTA|nr:unnamed protein product [Rangifer tarandus platyrhynchus]
MRQEGRRAGEPRTLTGRRTQQRGVPPLFLGTRNLFPCPARAPRPPAPASPYPISEHGHSPLVRPAER